MEYLSKEELYFSWWCEELEKAEYINSFGECKTYELGEKIVNKYQEQLKTKTKEKEQTILNGCEYTPDFEINWNEKGKNIFFDFYTQSFKESHKINLDLLIADRDYEIIGTTLANGQSSIFKSIIEIKPVYDQNNMTRLNGINRKWMYQKYGIFVNLVKVPDIFKDTFTPKRYLLTDSGKQNRVINFKVRTLEEFLKLNIKI